MKTSELKEIKEILHSQSRKYEIVPNLLEDANA